VFKKSNVFYKQHEGKISKLSLLLKEKMKKLNEKNDSVELIEDFADECLNIFKLVFLIQKSKNQLRKVGLVFYDKHTLESPFEKMKLMIEVLLLRNFFEWEIILVNQSIEYELQKASDFILSVAMENSSR
jgi:hypothetical protein